MAQRQRAFRTGPAGSWLTQLSLVLMLCICARSRAEEPENPLRRAKVGDRAAFDFTVTMGNDAPVRVVATVTVTAVDKEKVTLQVQMTGPDGPMPLSEGYARLDQPFAVGLVGALPSGVTAKAKATRKGAKTITVGKKTYRCTKYFHEYSTKSKGNGVDLEMKGEVFHSPDAPGNGIVLSTHAGTTTFRSEHGKSTVKTRHILKLKPAAPAQAPKPQGEQGVGELDP